MRLFRLSAALLSLLLAFCAPELESAPRRPIRSILVSGRKYVSMSDTANHYGLKMAVRGDDIFLYSKHVKAEFNLKKRAGSFNNLKVHWFFVPLKRGNAYYLSELDLLVQLDPLLRPKSLPKRPVRTVLIDPGHGGKDTGAIGVNGKKEKEIALAIALKLRRKLVKLGYSVRLTRAGDNFPTLEKRVNIFKASNPKPDLYISIHCNSAGDRNVSGIETFAATPAGAPSTADAAPGTQAFPGNQFNKYNLQLAYDIQRALVKNLPYATDRGVKHARFYVIRNVQCPAVLIETGFLSNRPECIRLSSDAYQEQVASAILAGILSYAAKVR